MADLTVAYLLAIFGFFGLSGLNRFYLGKPVTGVIWFLTGGLFFIGTFYDLATMRRQVEAHNAGRARRPIAPPMAPALPAPPAADLELRLMRVSRLHRGRITTVLAAAELGVGIADAERELDRLVAAGHAEIEVTDDGVIVYDFPALRLATA
jgi:hypothetical protein